VSKYLFIESRDPWEHNDALHTWELAKSLAGGGSDVPFFLVQNGVLAARTGAKTSTLKGGDGIRIYADDVSLAERGMSAALVRADITVSDMDSLVDLTLEEGRKPIWT